MLCERINTSIKKLPNTNSLILKKFSGLISCGLESRHKFIANAAAETWNSTFGNQGSLDYPPRVLEALARLRLVAELKLPSFPDRLPTEVSVLVHIFHPPLANTLYSSTPMHLYSLNRKSMNQRHRYRCLQISSAPFLLLLVSSVST